MHQVRCVRNYVLVVKTVLKQTEEDGKGHTHKVQARDAPICCSVAAPRASRASSPPMAVAAPVALMLARSWVKETTPSLS